MTSPYERPASLPPVAPEAYWYTIADICLVLHCSRATAHRYLGRVPATEKVKVTRKIDGVRTTRYWRVSPVAVRRLGHTTGLAPYL